MINRAILFYLLYSAIVFFFINVAEVEGKGLQATRTISADELRLRHSVSTSILINAPPSVVWQAIHDERQVASDLVSSKVLENDGNNCILEQRWRIVPYLKDTSCTVSETEYGNERIDFRLLSSDQFKVMQGAWLLTPVFNGEATQLDLRAYLQLKGFRAPWVVQMIAKRKMSNRLGRIKEMAEAGAMGSQVHGKLL